MRFIHMIAYFIALMCNCIKVEFHLTSGYDVP